MLQRPYVLCLQLINDFSAIMNAALYLNPFVIQEIFYGGLLN